LRERGGDLVIRRGDPVAETMRLAGSAGARAVFVADDVTRYAAWRRRRLEADCARHRLRLTVTPQHGVVPAGQVSPAGGGHYRVFTPYWRAWLAATWRGQCPAPEAISVPGMGDTGDIPGDATGYSPGLAPGGERAARERVHRWVDGALAGYPGGHDDLAVGATAQVSAYLRFGGQILNPGLHLPQQRGQLHNLSPQARDLRIPLSQQLPEPGVRSPQPRGGIVMRCGTIRRNGRIGHTPHTARASPP
jgi:deoxyribodipyrimidine photo-lyase